MIFWILCAALAAGVVLALTRPLSPASGTSGDDARQADLEVYRDQLREIDTDLARAFITSTEAEAARLEISRRILAREDAASSAGSLDTPTPFLMRTSYVIAAAVPLLALGIYVTLGSPGLPGRPAADRTAEMPANVASIMPLVERVEARLREQPQDGQGWDVIAPIYLRLERYQDAVNAFQRAMSLLGETPRRLGGLAEALVMANNGAVVQDARKAFSRLLELDPQRSEARFWLAMAREQDGEVAAAAAEYRALLAEAPPDAPWREMVEERLAIVEGKRPPSLSAEQLAQIEGMVAGLAQRLRTDGTDVAGWRRLLQSYTVLGRKDDAVAALKDARVALAGRTEALAEIDTFAKGLGIGNEGRNGSSP